MQKIDQNSGFKTLTDNFVINKVDRFLNEITMYRLVLYVLIGYLGVAVLLGFVGKLPFSGLTLIFSTLLLLSVSYLTNLLFSAIFKAPRNSESSLITALILACIITPSINSTGLIFLSLVALLATASKYILVINKKHLFNPAAAAVIITSLTINQSASWWIGTGILLPFTLVGGFLIIRKINRREMMWSFFITSGLVILSTIITRGEDTVNLATRTLLDTPLIFFASVMLTEPLTTPPTKLNQMIYGAITGFFFAPQLHIGSFYATPEMALALGNVYSFIIGPKRKFVLTLKEKHSLAKDILEFTFSIDHPINFLPGQYIEWTMSHPNSDSRGDRRYFTIASSPTENEIKTGVKFNQKGSSFKNHLLELTPGQSVIVSQLCGNFTLPKDHKEKLVFLAGGIGVTPFRSMIKYLLDKKERRDVVIIYTVKDKNELAYLDIFTQAQRELGIKAFYFVNQRIDTEVIQKNIPDFKERTFYISGPLGMVTAFKGNLNKLGVDKVVTDYFPGFDS